MTSVLFKKRTFMILSDDSTKSVSMPILLQLFVALTLFFALSYVAYCNFTRSSMINDLEHHKTRAGVYEAKNRALVDSMEEMGRIVDVSLRYLERADKPDKAHDLRQMMDEIENRARNTIENAEEVTDVPMGYLGRMAEDIKHKVVGVEKLLAMFGLSNTDVPIVHDAAHDVAREVDGDEAVGGEFVPAPIVYKPSVTSTVSQLEYQLMKWVNLKNFTRSLPIGKPMEFTRISSKFGRRIDPFVRKVAMHSGIDLVAPLGTQIRATGAGTVVSAGYMGSYGNAVIIDHGNKIKAIYAHMKSVRVKKGQKVRRGDGLGYIGSTGRSSGTHLHYQIEVAGRAIDPEHFLYIKSH